MALRYHWIIGLAMSLSMAKVIAGYSSLVKDPELVELTVSGQELAPNITPLKLCLRLEQPYVMRIENTQPFVVAIHYEEFGQHVRTYSLKGTNSVTSQSLLIPAHGTVQWHFDPTQVGQFELSATNIALRGKGEVGIIEVVSPQ